MKKVTFLAMILLVLAGVAFGQQAKNGGIAREAAMGGSQAGSGLVLNPFIMDDPALMLLNPSYMAMYKDYGWSNIGGGSLSGLSTGDNGYNLQNAGIAFGLNEDWALGAIFSYDPSAVNFVSGLGSISPVFQRAAQPIPSVANVFEVVAAFHVPSVDFGLGFMMGWSNRDANTTIGTANSTTEASARLWGFRGGANIDLGGGSSLDLSGALRLDKATDKIDHTPSIADEGGDYSTSGTEIQVTARGKFKITNKFNFVPYGGFLTASAEPKEDAPPSNVAATQNSDKWSANAYALGVGGEYRTQTFYLAGGVSWQTASVKRELTVPPATTVTTTARYTALPVFNLGGEWWFTDWLAGRAGYFRSSGSVNVKTEGTGVNSETNNTAGANVFGFLFLPGVNSNIVVGGLNPATWDGVSTFGIGLRFGGWAFDATVSDEALRRGLGLIGSQDDINTFGYVTASFNFAE